MNGAGTSRTESGVTTHTRGFPTGDDAEGRQAAITTGNTTTGATPLGTFLYNADGALVARKTLAGGTVTATTHYAGGIYERDLSAGTGKRYYAFGGRLVAQRDGLTQANGTGTVTFLHQDHLGSTSLQTNAVTGTYAAHSFRGPFGQSLPQSWASGGTLGTDLQYTGQRSFEGGLGSVMHYGAR